MTDAEIAAALAALGHEARLKLFRLLVRAGPEGLSVGEIGRHLSIPPSTLAHHLGALVAAGEGSLLPHLRGLLTPQQISELTVIYRRAAEGLPAPTVEETANETAGFDSVFNDEDDGTE